MQQLCRPMNGLAGGPAGPRLSRPSIARRSSVTVRSQSGDGNSRPSVDWDGAWSSFQREMRSQVEIKDSPPSGGSPFTSTSTPRRPAVRRVMPVSSTNSWGGQEGERIRRAERVLVDIWSSADFLKAGTVASIVLVVVFVLLIGPPPPDGRCSLFWC